MLKTQIKTKIVFYVDSNDNDLLNHCGYYDNLEQCANSIARSKMYSKEKFNSIDYNNDKEFEYFQKVEKRFTRLIKYYLNPKRNK